MTAQRRARIVALLAGPVAALAVLALPISYAWALVAIPIAGGAVVVEDVAAHRVAPPDALFPTRSLSGLSYALKRFLDVVVGAFLLWATAPVLGLAAIAVKLSTRGRVFERVVRSLPEGEYTFHRLRTRDANGRRTSVGRLLYRTGLDYLPMTIDVVRGRLSLVGPRLWTLREWRRVAGDAAGWVPLQTPHTVRAGITGPWVLPRYARMPQTADEMIEMDRYYLDHWSIWLDLKILALTPVRMFSGSYAESDTWVAPPGSTPPVEEPREGRRAGRAG